MYNENLIGFAKCRFSHKVGISPYCRGLSLNGDRYKYVGAWGGGCSNDIENYVQLIMSMKLCYLNNFVCYNETVILPVYHK